MSNSFGPETTYVEGYTWDESYEDDVTVGIGAICEHGNCAVLASDVRVSFHPMRVEAHDWSGKQYYFAPFNLAAVIAGSTSSTQAIVSQLSDNLKYLLLAKQKKPEFQPQFEHIRNALEQARKRELRRLQTCEMELQLGVSLQDWIAGKLPSGDVFNEYAHAEGRKVLRGVRDEFLGKFGIILTGFLNGSAVFLRGRGFEPVEEGVTPAIHVIGHGGKAALEVLNRRKQNVEMGIARTILHVYQALEAAQTDKTVGKASSYVVMRPWGSSRPHGMLRFRADHPTIKQWDAQYRLKSTEGLESSFANRLIDLALTPARVPNKRDLLGPKAMTELL